VTFGSKELLEKPGVLAWYNNLKRGSSATADLYLRVLAKFCRDAGLTPDDLARMDERDVRAKVLDYVTEMTERGLSSSYKRSVVNAVRSWLLHCGRNVYLNVKVERGSPKIAETEKVPKRSELRKILSVADLKTRVAIALMAFAGVRVEVLGNYDGTDGLRLGDFPELLIGPSEVTFANEPAMVVVRASLNKARHQYFTFLCEEGMEYVLDYLRLRIMRGEKLSPESPLIPSSRGGFMRARSIGDMIRRAIRLAGFDWRPYVFRHYFDTYMLMAEGRRMLPRDYRVFWMGHKGDIEHQYTTNKHRLPDPLVADMRVSYMQAASLFLETRPRDEERGSERIPKQKVVTAEELEEYLEGGWEYVTTLPDGRIVVRRS